MIISCWLGADVWTGPCCERVVSAHSQCWVLEEGQQTVHYHLEIIGSLIGIRNYVKKNRLSCIQISQNTYIYSNLD